nr:hypothetical protein [uncultured Sphingomonas sp.]
MRFRLLKAPLLLLLGVATFGTFVLTIILLFNPLRFLPDTRSDATAIVVGAMIAAVYFACLVGVLREQRWAAALVGFGVAGRLAMVAVFHSVAFPAKGDPTANINMAANILAGNGLLLDVAGPSGGLVFRALYPPSYPVLLAAMSALIGEGFPAVLLLNGLIDLALAGSIWMLAAHFVSRRRACLSAIIAWSFPMIIALSVTAQKEVLAIICLTQWAVGIVRLDVRSSWTELARVGLATAALALTQPAWMTAIAGIGLVFLSYWGWQKWLNIVCRSLPIFLIAMLPWWIRNYLIFHDFVALTTSYGNNLLYVVTNEFNALDVYNRSTGATEIGSAKLAWSMATSAIADNPGRYMLSRFIDGTYAWSLNSFAADLLRVSAANVTATMALTYALQFAHLGFIVATFHAARGSDERARLLLLLALGCMIGVIAGGIWFEYSQRHRYMFFPIFVALLVMTPARRSQATSGRSANHSR